MVFTLDDGRMLSLYWREPELGLEATGVGGSLFLCSLEAS